MINTLNVPTNPEGDTQFVAAVGPGAEHFSRSEHDVAFGDETGQWLVEFDLAASFDPAGASEQNIGSISLQPLETTNPSSAGWAMVARWVNPQSPTTWNADFGYFDAQGSFVLAQVANPNFQNLLINRWYRVTATVDLDENLIVEVSISDVANPQIAAAYAPTDWYLGGGAAGGLPAPSQVRIFAGAPSVAGNMLAIDNFAIKSVGTSTCPWDCGDMDGAVGVVDFLELLVQWSQPGSCDFDGGGVGTSDFLALLAAWGDCP